jgi:hypothetical protein
MTTAERAAAPLLSNIPPREPDGPGQFAFADPARAHRILEDSGWDDIEMRPVDVACTFPEKELVRYFTRLGRWAGSSTKRMSGRAFESSKSSATRSTRMCMATKSVSTQPAGCSAPVHRADRDRLEQGMLP